jgi:hypothetical protein
VAPAETKRQLSIWLLQAIECQKGSPPSTTSATNTLTHNNGVNDIGQLPRIIFDRARLPRALVNDEENLDLVSLG